MDEHKSWRDTLLRIVALLGLIVVLLLGAWGIILLAFNLPSIAGSIGNAVTSLVTGASFGNGDEESLSLDAPSASASGQALVLSWDHRGKGEYDYAVSYECVSGLSVKAPTPAGQYQNVACDTPFNYVGASESMVVIPTLAGKAAADVTFTVSAVEIESGSVTATASAEVSINPAASSAAATPAGTASGNQGTYIPAARASNLYGYPDLAVRLLSVSPVAYAQGRSTVQFEVANYGTNVARSGWNFDAALPISGTYTYRAPAQQALYPGDRIVYTLTFDDGRYEYDRYDSRYDDERYDECGESQSGWDEDDWFDWYQDTWNTGSNSREDWDEDEWEDWYDDFCDDYENDRGSYGYSGNRALVITADPNNYIGELNESNNRVSATLR